MTIDTVTADLGAVCFGTIRVCGEHSVNLGVARKFNEYARETAGVEIHCNRIPVRRFRDRGAVRQHVKPGKAKDLDSRLELVHLSRRCLECADNNKKRGDDRRQNGKTRKIHRSITS